MKRQGNIYHLMISDENILAAIQEVNNTHRWRKHHKPNKIVAWVEKDIPARIKELRQIIEDGFEATIKEPKRIYDVASEKYRDIYEPRLYPDQYIHHILIQVLQKPIMKRMDPWVCGSIPGRGIRYGVKGITKWMKNKKKTKYCAELDIRHFYQSIKPELVMDSLKTIIKDKKVLDLCERILKPGIMIGYYTSQWFANLVLQDLDKIIRSQASEYIRYMDNITIFSPNKRKLRKLVTTISEWLNEHGLELKCTWQVFRTDKRMPQALGYRYGRTFLILRKKTLLRLKKLLARVYRRIKKLGKPTIHQAQSLLSRIGQLKWCNSCTIIKKYLKKGLIAKLKNIVRTAQRREQAKWNISLVNPQDMAMS